MPPSVTTPPEMAANTPVSSKKKKRPCQFCQRSRWAMVFVFLSVMMAVALLNTAAPQG